MRLLIFLKGRLKLDYDNVLAAQMMSQRGFVGADRLADLLLTPVERHI